MNFIIVLISIIILIYFSLVQIYKKSITKRLRRQKLVTLVVFGSGGHTTEMMSILTGLDSSIFSQLHFVIAFNDKITYEKLATNDSILKHFTFRIEKIPRAREVGQSYLVATIKTISALFYSFLLLVRLRPNVLLCNGPGTCVPLCLASVLYRNLYFKYISIVYIESICRVESLSLSGKIIYPFSDHFFVQWKRLSDKYQNVQYLGKVL